MSIQRAPIYPKACPLNKFGAKVEDVLNWNCNARVSPQNCIGLSTLPSGEVPMTNTPVYGRAANDDAINRIELNYFAGLHGDRDVGHLIESVKIQRRALRKLFDYFKKKPFHSVHVADPVVSSELTHLKELVSMEDPISLR